MWHLCRVIFLLDHTVAKVVKGEERIRQLDIGDDYETSFERAVLARTSGLHHYFFERCLGIIYDLREPGLLHLFGRTVQFLQRSVLVTVLGSIQTTGWDSLLATPTSLLTTPTSILATPTSILVTPTPLPAPPQLSWLAFHPNNGQAQTCIASGGMTFKWDHRLPAFK